MSRLILCFLTLFCLISATFAHPLPDIPVRAEFQGGKARIELELDPRVFEEDPEAELYWLLWFTDMLDEQEKQELYARADEFIPTRVKFFFEPTGEFEPTFSNWRFRKLGNQDAEKLDDPMVMIAEWEGQIPAGATGYRIEALDEGILTVEFSNRLNGSEEELYQNLFPGENSRVLDISEANPRPDFSQVYFMLGLILVLGVIFLVLKKKVMG